MNRSAPRNLLLSLFCLAMLTSALLGSFGPARIGRAAGTTGAVAHPYLTDVSKSADPQHFVVTGADFTPGGMVYLAIYDQAGAALYEHRSIVASAAPDPYSAAQTVAAGTVPPTGGTFTATFTGLCGAAAMMRAEDATSQRWTGWLAVEPNCPSANAATVANDLDVSLRLPVAKPPMPAYAIANDVSAAAAKQTNPLELFNATGASASGDVVVSGLGFTAGHRVYIAVYDPMGARLYNGRWTRAQSSAVVSGFDAATDESPIVATSADGRFVVTLPGLCGANVMVRAYDETTQAWSNWVNVARCQTDSAVVYPSTRATIR